VEPPRRRLLSRLKILRARVLGQRTGKQASDRDSITTYDRLGVDKQNSIAKAVLKGKELGTGREEKYRKGRGATVSQICFSKKMRAKRKNWGG